MTIANWNLARVLPQQIRLTRIQAHLSSQIADVWFFTETHEDVSPDMRFYQIVSGEPDRESQSGERWAAIWSRWPVVPLGEFVSDKARCAAGRIVTSPHGELILYCSVLPWNNSWHGIPAAGGRAYAAALNVQREDWIRLRAEFPNATFILAGDFNQSLADRHYFGSKLKRSLLGRALEEAGLEPLTAGAKDPIARESSPYACIDHICISGDKNWELVATSRWPNSPAPIKRISDHFGVRVELIRRNQ